MADGKIDLASRLKEIMGLKDGDIGSAVLGAGTAMLGAGIATTVMSYGPQAMASALNSLVPAATGAAIGAARAAGR